MNAQLGPAVATRDLSAGYGATTALAKVSFELPHGATLGVLGPNGSGKTTLIRVLLGELEARSGSFEVAGKPALVAQGARTRLDFPVTAIEVVQMGAFARTKWYRRLSSADRDLAMHSIERVGLSEFAHKLFGELSGGQRQRVLIARALVQNSAVLLLDEPFSGVDHSSEQRILELLDDLRGENRSVVVTTHDLAQSQRWDYVLCLNRDQIAFGAPAQTLTKPILEQTYGDELVTLGGGLEVTTTHHGHGSA